MYVAVVDLAMVLLFWSGGAIIAIGPKRVFDHVAHSLQGKHRLLLARSGRWQTFKLHYEQSVRKQCAACGKSDGNIELHHILPFHRDPTKECDSTNVVWLCEDGPDDCHFVFGHNKHWKGWNQDVLCDSQQFKSRCERSKALIGGQSV